MSLLNSPQEELKILRILVIYSPLSVPAAPGYQRFPDGCWVLDDVPYTVSARLSHVTSPDFAESPKVQRRKGGSTKITRESSWNQAVSKS